MSKRYVLLTDLLEFKKGEVLKEEKDCPNYFNANGHSFYERIPLESIIHCPQHFKELTDTPPNPSNEEFIWTDELVWECLCSIPKDTLVTYKEHIIKFKQSKEKSKVNDGVSHTYNLNKGEIVSVEVGGVKYLSPEEVLEKEKKAFEAATKNSLAGNYCSFYYKYPTFEDYKKANP